jgi:nucleotide-binding universal stress UspA family protein
MEMSRILLPIDFTDASREALRYAHTLTTGDKSELHLLHVVPDACREPWAGECVGLDLASLTEEWVRDGMIRLKGIARDLGLPTPVRTSVRLGTAPEQIVAYAAEQQIGLIVMGAHRDAKAGDGLRGSIAERIVRRATCPVLTVPGGVPGVAVPDDAGHSLGQEPEPVIRTILIPVDFSIPSHVALRRGLELARRYGARVDVLYVYDPPWARNLAYIAPPAHLTEELRYRAEGKLASDVASHHDGTLDVRTTVRVGDPYAEIVRYAGDVHADLIVMGTHSRHTLGRLLLGSVAQKVLRRAPCPVLTLHEERAGQTSAPQDVTPALAAL